MAELTRGGVVLPPPVQYRVRPDPVQNRVKGFFWKAKGYLVLFFDIHKNYLTAQETSQIPVWLYQTPFLPWNKNHSSNDCTFCCIVGNEFLFFRETFFRNLKIVDWYTFGFMNWFAVVINIILKSLLNIAFHETYIWPFLWPQGFLIESSCIFIFFDMTSDTYSGSYDLRQKAKLSQAVLYLTIQVPRYSAIVSTVLLPLHWQQVSLPDVSPNFLAFSKTKELWFKNSINFILYWVSQ